MARGIAKCHCKTCGSDFEKIAYKYNSREARSWEEWAVGWYDECPACYSARMKVERLEEYQEACKTYSIPEIVGKSEKQIAYANDLRSKFYMENKETFKKWLDALTLAASSEYRAFADKNGITPEAELESIKAKFHECWLIDFLMHESDAGKVIEKLKEVV